MNGLRVWILTVYDPDSGLAADPVGVAGVDASANGWVSWLDPYWAPARSEPWRRLLDTQGPTPASLVVAAVDDVNQVTIGAVESDPGDGPDLAGAVEQLVDRLLVERAG